VGEERRVLRQQQRLDEERRDVGPGDEVGRGRRDLDRTLGAIEGRHRLREVATQPQELRRELRRGREIEPLGDDERRGVAHRPVGAHLGAERAQGLGCGRGLEDERREQSCEVQAVDSGRERQTALARTARQLGFALALRTNRGHPPVGVEAAVGAAFPMRHSIHHTELERGRAVEQEPPETLGRQMGRPHLEPASARIGRKDERQALGRLPQLGGRSGIAVPHGWVQPELEPRGELDDGGADGNAKDGTPFRACSPAPDGRRNALEAQLPEPGLLHDDAAQQEQGPEPDARALHSGADPVPRGFRLDPRGDPLLETESQDPDSSQRDEQEENGAQDPGAEPSHRKINVAESPEGSPRESVTSVTPRPLRYRVKRKRARVKFTAAYVALSGTHSLTST
jgi:hypothetical protein